MMEILWRGYSHWAMFFVGGFAFLCVGAINEIISWDVPLIVQMILGGQIITMIEFVAGCVLNLWLKWNVWDYSNLPFNVLGQICLPFTLLWCLISLIAILLDDWLRWKLFGEEKPHYKIVQEDKNMANEMNKVPCGGFKVGGGLSVNDAILKQLYGYATVNEGFDIKWDGKETVFVPLGGGEQGLAKISDEYRPFDDFIGSFIFLSDSSSPIQYCSASSTHVESYDKSWLALLSGGSYGFGYFEKGEYTMYGRVPVSFPVSGLYVMAEYYDEAAVVIPAITRIQKVPSYNITKLPGEFTTLEGGYINSFDQISAIAFEGIIIKEVWENNTISCSFNTGFDFESLEKNMDIWGIIDGASFEREFGLNTKISLSEKYDIIFKKDGIITLHATSIPNSNIEATIYVGYHKGRKRRTIDVVG